MPGVLLSPPPKDTAFFEKSTGRISSVWLTWLNSITATGAVVQSLQTLQTAAEDTATDGNSAAVLAEMVDALALLDQGTRVLPVSDDAAYALAPNFREAPALADLLPALDAANNAWRAEADELRALIAAGDPLPFGPCSHNLHTEILCDLAGPITQTSGDFIYVLGVPD